MECFKNCEVYLDDAKKPVKKAGLKSGHGPQRIALKNPVKATKVRLKFIGSHACSNPGAAEIEVYAMSPAPKALGTFIAMNPMGGAGGRAKATTKATTVIPESPELAAKLYAGELGFKQMLLVHRHPYKISHDQAILKTFEPITKLMKERPRIDFPDADYVPHKNAQPKIPGTAYTK